MKKYIDDNGNLAPSVLIIDGMQVFNPTSEQYEAAGYHIMPIPNENEDPTPDNPTDDKLNMAKKQKIKEILKYDSSVEVNSFIYNGKAQWFTAEQRSNFKVSIDAAVLLGETEITFWLGAALTIPTEIATKGLAMIQRYADECYLVTQKHIEEVNNLLGIADVRSFDVTKGYPKRLVLSEIYNKEVWS